MTVFSLHVTLVDDFGRITRKQYKTEDLSGADLGAEYLLANTAAGNLATALAALSNAGILYYNLGREVTSGDTVTANANIDQGLTAVARKLNNKLTVLKVPAPVISVFNPDGSLDILDALVTGYTDLFKVGGDFTTSDGENITDLVSGRLDK